MSIFCTYIFTGDKPTLRQIKTNTEILLMSLFLSSCRKFRKKLHGKYRIRRKEVQKKTSQQQKTKNVETSFTDTLAEQLPLIFLSNGHYIFLHTCCKEKQRHRYRYRYTHTEKERCTMKFLCVYSVLCFTFYTRISTHPHTCTKYNVQIHPSTYYYYLYRYIIIVS